MGKPQDNHGESPINSLAARQYGYFGREQLEALGLTRGAVEHRLRARRLVRVHQGVYSLGPPRREPAAQAFAAVLACGPGAALSHSSAAFLWGLSKRWQTPPEVTVTRDARRDGITTHRTGSLDRRDIRTHLGIRMTSAARTLLDIAPRLTDPELTRAINDGRLSRRIYPAELEALLARLPTHRGAKRIRALVTPSAGPTRSELEDTFVAFTRRHGLPEPQINARVAGYEVDALFAEQKVIVELDGWEFHSDRRSFEGDRERDAALLAAGYVTVRITWERLTGDPEREARRLRVILERSRAAPKPSTWPR